MGDTSEKRDFSKIYFILFFEFFSNTELILVTIYNKFNNPGYSIYITWMYIIGFGLFGIELVVEVGVGVEVWV